MLWDLVMLKIVISIPVIWAGCSACLADDSPSGRDGIGKAGNEKSKARGDFAAQVEELLGIKDTGADIIPVLDEALGALNGDETRQGAAVRKLVRALLTGPHPDVLAKRDYALLDIDADKRDNDRDYLYYNQLRALCSTIWTLAQNAQASDPKTASDLARATLLLAVLHESYGEWTFCARNLLPKNESATKQLLDLADGKFEALGRVLREREHKEYILQTELTPALRAIDGLSASQGRIAPEAVKEIVSRLDKVFREGAADDGERWDMLINTWCLLNLVRTRQSSEAQEVIKAQLVQWGRDFPSPNIQRWVDQALKTEGPPPGKLLVELILQPDGKMVPKAPADNRK